MTSSAAPTRLEAFTPATLPARWMTCTPAAVSRATDPAGVRTPVGTRHARAMGSMTTRCGSFAATWVNFHTQAFEPGHPDACSRCRDLMQFDLDH